MLNLAFSMNLRDNKSGFVLCRREVLTDALGDADGYRYFQSFLGVALAIRGYRFAQVDTRFDSRQAGESFLSALPGDRVAKNLRRAGALSAVARFRASTR